MPPAVYPDVPGAGGLFQLHDLRLSASQLRNVRVGIQHIVRGACAHRGLRRKVWRGAQLHPAVLPGDRPQIRGVPRAVNFQPLDRLFLAQVVFQVSAGPPGVAVVRSPFGPCQKGGVNRLVGIRAPARIGNDPIRGGSSVLHAHVRRRHFPLQNIFALRQLLQLLNSRPKAFICGFGLPGGGAAACLHRLRGAAGRRVFPPGRRGVFPRVQPPCQQRIQIGRGLQGLDRLVQRFVRRQNLPGRGFLVCQHGPGSRSRCEVAVPGCGGILGLGVRPVRQGLQRGLVHPAFSILHVNVQAGRQPCRVCHPLRQLPQGAPKHRGHPGRLAGKAAHLPVHRHIPLVQQAQLLCGRAHQYRHRGGQPGQQLSLACAIGHHQVALVRHHLADVAFGLLVVGPPHADVIHVKGGVQAGVVAVPVRRPQPQRQQQALGDRVHIVRVAGAAGLPLRRGPAAFRRLGGAVKFPHQGPVHIKFLVARAPFQPVHMVGFAGVKGIAVSPNAGAPVGVHVLPGRFH